VNAQFPGQTNNDEYKRKMGLTTIHDYRLIGDCIKELHNILGQQIRSPTGKKYLPFAGKLPFAMVSPILGPLWTRNAFEHFV